MTKELTLRIPDGLFKVIDKFKEISGVSYTNFIYNSIMWYCIQKNLISIDYFKNLNGKKAGTMEEIYRATANPLPEELKFCDGDSCEIEYGKDREINMEIKHKGNKINNKSM